MKKWLERIITSIIIISIFFISIYFVLIVKNLATLLSTLQNKIEIYELYRQEELDNLEEMFGLTIENDKKQIEIDNMQQVEIENLTKFLIAFSQIIKENNKTQLKTIEVINFTIDKLITLQKEMLGDLNKTKRIDLDNVEEIRKANIVAYNTTANVSGSGSHIVIRGKDYILTVAHLIKDEKDYVWGILDDGTWLPLTLIKINRKKDLALFRIYGVENLPHLEISNEFPTQGSEVIVIGNPDNLTDIITDGVIAKIKKNGYILTNKIYYGNSGGAILYKGKIIGVVTSIAVHFRFPAIVNYTYGVKLEVINEFLDRK